MNKKAQDVWHLDEFIFLILNLIFFLMLSLFIINAKSGAFVNEQYYAKKIGLLIDGAKPGTELLVDVTDGYNLAKKNNLDEKTIFRFDQNKVFVSFSTSRSYSFSYFSNVSVQVPNYPFVIKDSGKEVFLDIYVK